MKFGQLLSQQEIPGFVRPWLISTLFCELILIFPTSSIASFAVTESMALFDPFSSQFYIERYATISTVSSCW